jgi:LAO/AO transport system ATPase
MAYAPSLSLIPRIEAGQPAAVGRLISRAESGVAEAREALAQIYRRAGRAHVIGVTGVPGSGKSTLVAKLARLIRDGGAKVGIVAIDPSSPFSGGAILGDRIRMADLGLDAGVYIRSMATRGAMGGMARAALDAVDILEVAGFDPIIIETVGVGQDEVEIARASHTTIVVSAPGLGDEVQAIKAGMLEIADIHVVSKCDRSDANRTIMDITSMLTLGVRRGSVRMGNPGGRRQRDPGPGSRRVDDGAWPLTARWRSRPTQGGNASSRSPAFACTRRRRTCCWRASCGPAGHRKTTLPRNCSSANPTPIRWPGNSSSPR